MFSFCFPPAELNKLRSSTTEDNREPARSWRPKDMACWFAQLSSSTEMVLKAGQIRLRLLHNYQILSEKLVKWMNLRKIVENSPSCQYVLQNTLTLLINSIWFLCKRDFEAVHCICFISIDLYVPMCLIMTTMTTTTGPKEKYAVKLLHKQSVLPKKSKITSWNRFLFNPTNSHIIQTRPACICTRQGRQFGRSTKHMALDSAQLLYI